MDVDGKFVFVGVTAKGVMPQVATPIGLLEPSLYTSGAGRVDASREQSIYS
jgi:CHASE2 domain-containing sensor protein